MTKAKDSIRYGDVFRVGRHVVGCGDARDAEVVKRVVGTTKIKAVNADPPYAVRVVESKAGFSNLKMPKNILNDDIASESAYTKFTKDWIIPILPHLASKNSFHVFNSDLMIFALRAGMEEAGVHFSQLLLWLKNHAVIGRKDYLPQFELIAYGWHGKHEFKKTKDKSVLWYPRPARSPLHPTTKPVGLIRRLILNTTATGEAVYDPMAGSGTAGIAAEQTKRVALLIERDEDYCQTILDRLSQATGCQVEHLKKKP